jgi:hypothetical protein
MLFLLFEVVFLLLGFRKLFGTKQVFYIGNIFRSWHHNDFHSLGVCGSFYFPVNQEQGFGGLVVSILATGTRVHGFKPG